MCASQSSPLVTTEPRFYSRWLEWDSVTTTSRIGRGYCLALCNLEDVSIGRLFGAVLDDLAGRTTNSCSCLCAGNWGMQKVDGWDNTEPLKRGELESLEGDAIG